MPDSSDVVTPQGGRIGAKQSFYYRIAEDAFVECFSVAARRRETRANTQRGSNEEQALYELEERQLAASVRCIVFAAMCLEAAIYDYAAWHLPTLVVEGLDKVDFLSKWRIIPLLVAKHQIPAGKLTHNALKSLQVLRNKLVHSKSVAMVHGEAMKRQLDLLEEDNNAIAEGYGVAMEAIIATSIEMDLHAPATINPLPHFIPPQEGRIYLLDPDRPRELTPLIAKCRRSLMASRSR